MKEKNNKLFTNAEEKIKELADEIKRISGSQANLWQKIPFLALQANGRGGYSGCYQCAYENGFWIIEDSNRDVKVDIDLETGNLVNPFRLTEKISDTQIISLVPILQEIDAAAIIEDLKHTIKTFRDNTGENEKRKKIIKRLDLKPDRYKRKISLKEIEKKNISDLVVA